MRHDTERNRPERTDASHGLRAMALRARAMLCEKVGSKPAASESLIAGLASVILPPSDEPTVPPLGLDPLQVRLYEAWRIEVPVMRWTQPATRALRVSPQVYHSEAQYRYLAEALGGTSMGRVG